MIDPALEPLYALKGASATRARAYTALEARSAALRDRADLVRDVAYGPGPRQRLDVFTRDGIGAPIFVFVHGGYWRALEKEIFLALAAPFAARGWVAINLEYGLRPEFAFREIVDQVTEAVAFIATRSGRWGGDGGRIVLAGHSAGGHMVAWAAAKPSLPIRAVAPISGIFDLEPLLHTSINADLGLDAATARALSPQHRLPAVMPPTLALVGGGETEGFKAQTRNYAAALRAAGHPAEDHAAGDYDHFTICEALADPDSDVFARLAAFAEAAV